MASKVQESLVVLANSGTPRSGQVSFTNPVTAGNALVVAFNQYVSSIRTYTASSSISGSLGSPVVTNNPGQGVGAFVLRNVAGGSHTITVAATSGTTNFELQAFEISGLHATNPIVVGFFTDTEDTFNHNSAAIDEIDIPGPGFGLTIGVLNSSSGVTTTVANTGDGWAKPSNVSADLRAFSQFKIITVAENNQRGAWTHTGGSARTGVSAMLFIPDADPPPPPETVIRARITFRRFDGGF